MACEVCEHCDTPISRHDRVTIKEGFSYHKKCHKCYVCSETNLEDAEVFKGVIFCSSCAQKIFQGCSTARKTKTMLSRKLRRPRSRTHRGCERREHSRRYRRIDRSRDGVIELVGLDHSPSDTDDSKKEKTRHEKPSKHAASTKYSVQVVSDRGEHCYHLQEMRNKSIEMGTTTEITQEQLKEFSSPEKECRTLHYKPTKLHETTSPRKHLRKKDKPICSDLRIAELGASTEIANMALRKKSEVPIIIMSDPRLKHRTSSGLSLINQESDISRNRCDSVESIYSIAPKKKWMDRRLGSILKLPLRSFKKNILNKSSLISTVKTASSEEKMSIFQKFKQLFYEEIVQHQERGIRKLYSAVNRKRVPYKLGWVELVARVSGIKETAPPSNGKEVVKSCKHFKESHSYRCMRAHVMRLAGPTKSELACIRHKIKRFVAPHFLKDIVHITKRRKSRNLKGSAMLDELQASEKVILNIKY